ncbi:hypothetical protein ACHAXR_000964, partial [Thalassiosira sp. AJA248-18]
MKHNENNDCETNSSPTLESGPKFNVNERVLCTDSQRHTTSANELPALFEAIIRKSGLKHVDPTTKQILPERKQPRGGRRRHHHHHQDPNQADGSIKEWCHLIHFQGWNSRWDIWLTEMHVFHDTSENRKRVGSVANGGKVVRSPPKPTKEEEKKKKKKRGRSKDARGGDGEDNEDGAKFGGIFQQNLQLITRACVLPFTLQTILVDDNDKITKRVYPPPSFNYSDKSTEEQNMGITMLHVLPVTMNIIDVLGQYVRVQKGEDLEEFAREQQRQREEGAKRQLSKPNAISDGDDHGANNEDPEVVAEEATKENLNKDDKKQTPSYSSKITTKEILKLRKKKRKQFALSIIALVDVSLPLFLLYKEERGQFVKFIEEEN